MQLEKLTVAFAKLGGFQEVAISLRKAEDLRQAVEKAFISVNYKAFLDEMQKLDEILRYKAHYESWNEYFERRDWLWGDILEDPETRWQYQKYVWGTPVRFAKQLFERARETQSLR